MPKKKLVIWGAAGHALVVSDIVRLQGDYELVGYLDSLTPIRKGEKLSNVEILGGEEQLSFLKGDGVDYLLIGFGACRARLEIAEKVKSMGFHLATAIHPQAIIAHDVRIGAGSVVAAGAVINPGTVIGENVIINTSSSVDHECIIEDGVHLSPGARLAGKVRINQATWIGIGAVVIEKVTVGSRSIIGAGAVVINDIPDNVVAFGVPAKIQRAHE